MTGPQRAWVGTGATQFVARAPDRIPDYDLRSGDHLWIVVSCYRVDPAGFTDPTRAPVLDTENLLTVQGPACYHCEEAYTPLLAKRRCKGSPSN